MIYSKLLVILVILLPMLAVATEYRPLVGIPGITGTGSLQDYLNTLYALSISIAALLAVIKIIIAGVKYMLSDVVTNKSSAIKDIQGSLLGLILVVMAWVILYVINPAILNVTVTTQPIVAPPPSAVAPPDAARALREAIEAGGGTPASVNIGNTNLDRTQFEAQCTSIGGAVQNTGTQFNCIHDPSTCDRNTTSICCNSNAGSYDPNFSHCRVSDNVYREVRCPGTPDPMGMGTIYDCTGVSCPNEGTGTTVRVGTATDRILCETTR